jgi:hypothetical protein
MSNPSFPPHQPTVRRPGSFREYPDQPISFNAAHYFLIGLQVDVRITFYLDAPHEAHDPLPEGVPEKLFRGQVMNSSFADCCEKNEIEIAFVIGRYNAGAILWQVLDAYNFVDPNEA